MPFCSCFASTHRVAPGIELGEDHDCIATRRAVRIVLAPLLAREILNRLGFQNYIPIAKIEIKDSYFVSPTNWKTLWLLLKEMGFLPTTTVLIHAWKPETKDSFNPDIGYFNFYGGMDAIHVPCDRPIQKALRKADADKLADWIRENIQSVQITYEDTAPTHDRSCMFPI